MMWNVSWKNIRASPPFGGRGQPPAVRAAPSFILARSTKFDKQKLKQEVNKILQSNGDFAIVWNDWEDENNEFSKEYFKYISSWNTKLTGKTYQHKNVDDRKKFFKNSEYKTYTFIHSKDYTIDMLIGLSKSLSYAPKEDSEYYDEFINGIITIFNKYKKDDIVRFDFHTEMFIGKI